MNDNHPMKTDHPEVPRETMKKAIDGIMDGPFQHSPTLQTMMQLSVDLKRNLQFTSSQKSKALFDVANTIILTAASSLIGIIGYRNIALMFKVLSENYYEIAGEGGAPDESATPPSTPKGGPVP